MDLSAMSSRTRKSSVAVRPKSKAKTARSPAPAPSPRRNIPLPSPRDSAISPLRRQPLAQQVYDEMFHRIVTGELAEGARLPSEHALCASFAVSRPVVREALERLRSDGIVASRRGSGTHVMPRPASLRAPPSVEKIDQLLQNLEFRSIVEPEAAAFAALRRTGRDLEAMLTAIEEFQRVTVIEGGIGYHLDFAFHVAVAAASSNVRLYESVRAVEYDIDHGVNLARHLSRFDHLERRRSVCDEHRHIFECIRQQDAEAARTAMRGHLEQARIRMMNRNPPLTKM
jgi:GntR family transcriptional regulator, transcriptional repressor for pyruvate dehydrogenase complex